MYSRTRSGAANPLMACVSTGNTWCCLHVLAASGAVRDLVPATLPASSLSIASHAEVVALVTLNSLCLYTPYPTSGMS